MSVCFHQDACDGPCDGILTGRPGAVSSLRRGIFEIRS
jgi:hypothetical protein